MSADPNSALSPRLVELLDAIRDQALAEKLRKVYRAAATAMQRLSDIDLVKYQSEGLDDSAADLSLWEEVAPVIRDTLMEVNALLMVIREQFVNSAPLSLGDRKAAAAESALISMQQLLAQEVTHFGERIRSPSVVSDRWTLLVDLQTFRTKFREQIGEMVHASASSFGDVSKAEVVPFFQQDLNAAITVRGTVSDLIRIITARIEKISEAEREDVQWNAQQLEKELDLFGKTPAYRTLRAQDVRTLLLFRHKLAQLAQDPHLPKQDLLSAVTPFGDFVRSLALVNRRDMLIEHDREVWAGCGVKLENAQQVVGSQPEAAAALLAEAASLGQALYGRDVELDAFLRRARKQPFSQLRGADLSQTLERFVQLLASLTVQ